MRTATAWVAEQQPRRSTPDNPAGSLRRGELAAGLATAALAGQLLFAPVTLLIAATLVAVGRVSRWRPQWLLAPAIARLIWMLETGISAGCRCASRSGSRQLAGYLLAAAVDPARLAHPGAAFAGAAAWLPRQLPLALLAAASEASIALWFGWWRVCRGAARPAQSFRPGRRPRSAAPPARPRRRCRRAARSPRRLRAGPAGQHRAVNRLQLGHGGERRAPYRRRSRPTWTSLAWRWRAPRCGFARPCCWRI